MSESHRTDYSTRLNANSIMSEMIARPHALIDVIRPSAIAHLDHVLELLAHDGPLDAKTIHEIRRNVKRIRALLQLVRSDLKSRVAEWDKILQSVNRTLSGARDLEVCLQTVRDLSTDVSPSQRNVLDRFSAELSRRQSVLLAADPAELRPELSAQLETVKAGLLEWQPRKSGFGLIRPALRKMSKQARKIIHRLREHVTSDDLHSLRKVVKRRLYWLETFEPIWPGDLREELEMVDSLSDRLGKHHDLAVLFDRLHDSEVAGDASMQHSVERVVHRLKQRQQKLERQALKSARRLFAERPKAMSQRWRSLVKTWQDSSAGTPPQGQSEPKAEDPFRVLHGELA